MFRFKLLAFIVSGFLFMPFVASAQLDLSLKARVTGFEGRFGETYQAIGYEPAVTIKPTTKPFAGGLSYSINRLVFDPNSDLSVDLTLINAHLGVKGTVAKYFHPFAYALFGFRLMGYEDESSYSESNQIFSTISFGYGGRTGLQIGGKKWRFEGSIDYMTGTNTRYLTPETFRKARNDDADYRDYAQRSTINSLAIEAGITYVFDWNE